MASCEIAVRVTPRSSKNSLRLEPDDSLRAWVMAAPTDGQANKAVCELVAKKLGIAKSSVTIVRGETSRQKTLSIADVSIEEALAKIRG